MSVFFHSSHSYLKRYPIAPGLHGLQEQMIQKLCDDARKSFTGQSFPNTSQNPQARNEQDAGDSAKSGV